MERKQIVIKDYSPQWAIQFEMLRSVYANCLQNLVIDIQHVGSTSVVGLAAKPIIDIDLIIDSPNKLSSVIEKLSDLGYEHLGDLGIKDREAFKMVSSLTPENGSGNDWPAHNLYVCLKDSISLKNHLALRDFLRTHPEKANEYGLLKKNLVSQNGYDIDYYIKSKTPFIIEILTQLGFDKNALEDIQKVNNAL
jgi:GrpB-like predicted nucleotidyltransferase (UPF0157 family)